MSTPINKLSDLDPTSVDSTGSARTSFDTSILTHEPETNSTLIEEQIKKFNLKPNEWAQEVIQHVKTTLPLGLPNFSMHIDKPRVNSRHWLETSALFAAYVKELAPKLNTFDNTIDHTQKLVLLNQFIDAIKNYGRQECDMGLTLERESILPAVISDFLQNIFFGKLTQAKSLSDYVLRGEIAQTFGAGDGEQMTVVGILHLLEKNGTNADIFPIRTFHPNVKFSELLHNTNKHLRPLNTYHCISFGSSAPEKFEKTPTFTPQIVLCDLYQSKSYSLSRAQKYEFPIDISHRFDIKTAEFVTVFDKPFTSSELKILNDKPKLAVSRAEVDHWVKEIYKSITGAELPQKFHLVVTDQKAAAEKIAAQAKFAAMSMKDIIARQAHASASTVNVNAGPSILTQLNAIRSTGIANGTNVGVGSEPRTNSASSLKQ